jgi:hypothetical protein
MTKLLRKSVMSAAVAGAAALTLALLAPGSLAAARAQPSRAGLAVLHVSGAAVHLGPYSALDVVSEAPNGTVYYATHDRILVVHGSRTRSFHAVSGRVLASVATNQDVFVQVGLIVSEYSSAAHFVRQWKLSSPFNPITTAGLFIAGHTVWSWTDWFTDESGLEFATVSEFTTTSSKVKVISKSDVYPFYLAADSTGLYYQSAYGSKSHLILTAPSGTITHRAVIAIPEDPMALSPGRVDLLSATNSRVSVASYRSSNLSSLGSKRIANAAPFSIAGTTAGLLALWCTGSCTKAYVAVLNPATGAISSKLAVPHAYFLMPGPAPAVLTDVSGQAYLLRLT